MELELEYVEKYAKTIDIIIKPISKPISKPQYEIKLRYMDNRVEILSITDISDLLKYLSPLTCMLIDLKEETNITGTYKFYNGINILVILHNDKPKYLDICECEKLLCTSTSLETYGLFSNTFTTIKISNNRYISGFPSRISIIKSKKFIVFSHSIHGSDNNYSVKKYCPKDLYVQLDEFSMQNCFEIIFEDNKSSHIKVIDSINLNGIIEYIQEQNLETPKQININNRICLLEPLNYS